MKRKAASVLALCLTVMFIFTGCGPEQLITLSDSERAQIVSYSAHIIGEFNKQMSEGYTSLNYGQLKAISDGMREEQNTDEPVADPDDNPDEPSDNPDNPSGGDSDDTPIGDPISLTEIIGIQNIKADVTGYNVKKDYVADGAFSMDARKGYKYLIINVRLTNSGSEDKWCDILSKGIKLSIRVNDSSTYSALDTLVPSDLLNYTGMVKAGKTANAILFFEIPEDTASNLSSLTLMYSLDGSIRTIKVK
ncbi:MAG: DUF4352 domain-containing protein [Lachnospiraceae bacterium]|nr:DUF4352 domain-containing protein [Lachnospiraceae bacterium]